MNGNHPGTSFEQKVAFNKIYGVCLSVLGLITLILSIVFNQYFTNDFISGFYSGTGGGLMVFGAFITLYYAILPKKQVKYKKCEIAYADERNRFIGTMSGNISFYISMVIFYIAAVIAGFFNITVLVVLLGVIVLMFIVLALSYIIIKASY
jgi:hypothetical protein